jgi:hypothetical protein
VAHTLVRNFGGNIRFTPNHVCTPRNEDEVLALLDRHKKSSIRVMGSLHGWSDAAETTDVLVDMRHFDWIATPDTRGGLVTVGAGCRLERLLEVLRTHAGLTLPTIGTVTKQTVAGAISTATHGSGCPSLSHYVAALRVAAYDRHGHPAVHDYWDGDDLRAARCGVGCTGIILSVTFKCRPLYYVSESVTIRDSIESIISAKDEYPLQEFALVPYYWKCVAYRRREGHPPSGVHSKCLTLLYRVYKTAVVDWLFHVTLKIGLYGRLLGGQFQLTALTFLFRSTPFLVWPAKVLTGAHGVMDRSDLALTRKHDYFRHVEMEVFVRAQDVASAAEVLQAITAVSAGESADVPQSVRALLANVDLLDPLNAQRGRYAHHYPLYFRRVLPDDTLISMTSGGAEYYAIGVFCYLDPRHRRRYFEYARFVATALIALFGARLHWGKYLPMFPEASVTSKQLEPLYPGLQDFRRCCADVDPNGAFRNDFSGRLLGLRRPDARPVRNSPLRRSSLVESMVPVAGRLSDESEAIYERQNPE